MVGWLFSLFLLLPSLFQAAEVKVFAHMDGSRTAEHRRMEGQILIQHPKEKEVVESSFTLESRALLVEFVDQRSPTVEELRKDAGLDSQAKVSIYRFQLPGRTKGLYILPSIAVVVGDKRYRSTASTYEVTTPILTENLELEALVEGEQPFYPNQQTVVKYRIYYNRNIELTEEYLPLIEGKGLQKIGEKEITDEQSESYTVQEIRQLVRFTEAGSYTYGPSIIEGVSYVERAGRRIYDKLRLRATASATTIEVAPFPEKDRPLSFTGAVGNFTMEVKLLTSGEIDLGERVEVGLQITGESGTEDLTIPELSCQPGFSGFFFIEEFPPFAQRTANSKQFILQLRPLSTHVSSIPSIEFSYFDPKDRQYKKLHTEAIPIQVSSLISYRPDTRSGKREEPVEKVAPQQDRNPLVEHLGANWRVGKPEGVIGPYRLLLSDLKVSQWRISSAWIALFLASTILIAQIPLRSKEEIKQPTSAYYLALAGEQRDNPAKMSSLIEESFFLLLIEKSYIFSKPLSAELLPDEGVSGQVRTFLLETAASRYGLKGEFVPKKVYKAAKKLYRAVQG